MRDYAKLNGLVIYEHDYTIIQMNCLSKRIPVAFLINLDRSPDRLSSCSKRLNQAGLEWQRFSAVSPANNESARLHHLYRPEKTVSTFGRHLTRGEIGCFLSHYEVMKIAIQEKLDYSIILEDDASPKFNALNSLGLIIEWLTKENPPVDWVHLSRITSSKYSRPIATFKGLEIYRSYRPPLSSGANLWTVKGMKDFVNHVEQNGIAAPVDDTMRSLFSRTARAASLMQQFLKRIIALRLLSRMVYWMSKKVSLIASQEKRLIIYFLITINCDNLSLRRALTLLEG